MEDKDAAGHLHLAVSGDEDSEVEDNNPHTAAGKHVEGLKEGWDLDK